MQDGVDGLPPLRLLFVQDHKFFKFLYHFQLQKNLLLAAKIILFDIKLICFVFVKILYAHG